MNLKLFTISRERGEERGARLRISTIYTNIKTSLFAVINQPTPLDIKGKIQYHKSICYIQLSLLIAAITEYRTPLQFKYFKLIHPNQCWNMKWNFPVTGPVFYPSVGCLVGWSVGMSVIISECFLFFYDIFKLLTMSCLECSWWLLAY